jgi:hypothetical protein
MREEMKKYSVEWKKARGSWVQKHKSEKWGNIWKVHYIKNDTEYSYGEYLTYTEALKAIGNK